MILPTRDSCIALTGVLQPLAWVHDIAANGTHHPERLMHSIKVILCTEPPDALSVYGDLEQLRDGIRALLQVLDGRGNTQLSAMERALLSRYTGQVLRLGKQIYRTPALASRIADGLQQVPTNSEAPDLTERQAEKMAALYLSVISPLQPRVMISGQHETLKNSRHVEAIRCHLLASVRSAVLWYQCGGRLWQLLLLRGLWSKQARQLASSLK